MVIRSGNSSQAIVQKGVTVRARRISSSAKHWIESQAHARVLHVFPKACNLINDEGSREKMEAAAIKIQDVGHSSGADAMAGFLAVNLTDPGTPPGGLRNQTKVQIHFLDADELSLDSIVEKDVQLSPGSRAHPLDQV